MVVREEPEIAYGPSRLAQLLADIQELGAAGERTKQKLEVVAAHAAYLTAAEKPVPEWVYELRKRIEQDEI